MKTGIKKVLVSTVALVSLFGVVPTLAASQQMEEDMHILMLIIVVE